MQHDPIDFFNHSKSAFHSAQLLFKTKHHSYGFRILFIHSLELILKSFIILKTGQRPPVEHNIIKLFNKCRNLGADNIFTKGTGLEDLLNALAEKFYADTVTARYPDLHKPLTWFPHNAFMIVEEAIIKPLEKEINSLSQ